MKRIGITQRVEVLEAYGERRDSLDQAWGHLFTHFETDLIPVPNTHSDIVGWAQRQKLEGLVLSGGNDLAHLANSNNPAPGRDAIEKALLHWAESKNLPVLGVCRGMQIMNWHLGGSLSELQGHVDSLHIVRPVSSVSIFNDYCMVNSFHNWGISLTDLTSLLEPLLLADDGTVEACKHRTLPWYGIMWHPERENDVSKALDLALIKAAFQLITR